MKALFDNWRRIAEDINLIWSTLGVLFVIGAAILGFFQRKHIKKMFYCLYDLAHGNYVIQDYVKRKLDIGSMLHRIGGLLPILVIDDNSVARNGMVEQLQGLGYKGTKGKYPITLDDEDLRKSLIIVIDINNVYFGYKKPLGGCNQGLAVAQAIKEKYGEKRVIMYSGNLDDYKDNYVLEKVVDEKFAKTDDLSTVREKIDKCMKVSLDPASLWRSIRDDLFARDENSISVVCLENQYVKNLMHIEKLTVEDVIASLKMVSRHSSIASASLSVLQECVKK